MAGANEVLDSVLRVIPHGKTVGGGAVAIEHRDGTTYALTNHHVAYQGLNVSVRARNGFETTGYVLWSDRYSDVALVRFEGHIEPLRAYQRDVVPGLDVYAAGHPDTRLWTLSKGIVCNINQRWDGHESAVNLLMTDAIVAKGSSGGALVTMTKEGPRLVGLLHSSIHAGYFGFAIPIKTALLVAREAFLADADPILGAA